MFFYFCMSLAMFFSALWVLKDAKEKGARNPGGWVIAVSLLWFVFFPLYLFKRRKIVPSTDSINGGVKPWVAIMIAALASAWPSYYQWREDNAVPECSNKQVVQVLSQRLNGADVQNPAERKDISTISRRSCNATVGGGIIDYNVSWYDDKHDQFVVRGGE